MGHLGAGGGTHTDIVPAEGQAGCERGVARAVERSPDRSPGPTEGLPARTDEEETCGRAGGVVWRPRPSAGVCHIVGFPRPSRTQGVPPADLGVGGRSSPLAWGGLRAVLCGVALRDRLFPRLAG